MPGSSSALPCPVCSPPSAARSSSCPTTSLNLSLLNPYLLGSLVAIALVLLTRSVLLSMLVSMLIFFLLRSWLA